jgi:hypothetical protein
MIKDGRSKHPPYGIWYSMISRCADKHKRHYNRHYGGRGVQVCERRRNDFWAFVADMGPRPSPKHSIDRYPNQNGDYETRQLPLGVSR